jgi:hypothetical protein
MILGYALDWGCDGTDTSEPPLPSSLRGQICDAEWAKDLLVGTPVVAPLVGGAISAWRASWRPFGVAVVVALATLAFGFGSGIEGARN